MGGYPEEGMPLLATVDPVWIRCGCAVGVPKAVYACLHGAPHFPALVLPEGARNGLLLLQ